MTTIFGLVVRDQNGRDRAWIYDYDDGAAEFGLAWTGAATRWRRSSDTEEPYLFLAEE